MLDNYRSEVNLHSPEDLSVPEADRKLNVSESLDCRQSPSDANVDTIKATETMLLQSSDQQEVRQDTENLFRSGTLSSRGTADSDSIFYERPADKNINELTKPIPTSITNEITPGQPILLKDAFLTPEPSALASESSDEICSPPSRNNSSHSIFHHEKPQRPAPPPTIGLHQQGSILTSAMNTLADEAVEAYYAMRRTPILSDAALDVSNGTLSAHSLLKCFRCHQMLTCLGLRKS